MAQLGFDLKIDKPAPYDNRVLRAEKTGNKALKPSKKFFQNLTTHYNYYFNASNKLNEVIDEAKTTFRDDYTELLPFYNYTLDATSQNSLQLDSVIYKSQTGLVMHDLRNDWADNMYLLWGAAWFFEKKFDSAALMFQFINYAFAEKEKDGYYKYIGSRLDGNNALSIATDEKKKSTSAYGSRNNAFLWQIRTFIEAGRIAEAGTLIATLKNDPFFPTRLNSQLEEVEAYWFYKQNVWDSSAVHLIKALDNAGTKQELARWEYLAAQMFEKTGDLEKAQQFYTRSIGHTTDPVMDVYSRLNVVRVTKDSTGNYIDRNVGELLKMARRDKYADYRDVIYYMAAQMELERNNFDAAKDLLLKASKYDNGNLSSRSRSFLMIADLAYDQKKYLEAAAFYDSVNVRDIQPREIKRIEQRKPLLSKIVAATNTISRQDSLQRIAAMPEEERTEYVNRLLKKMLKEQGVSDAALTSGNVMTSTPSDLFQPSKQKGEWYFYNTTLKTQGAAQFKQVWGNRPNVDNWRRFSSVSQQLTTRLPSNVVDNKNAPVTPPVDNTPSFSNLMSNLPLTEDQVKASNDSISNALFTLGNVLLNEAEDYLSAIDAYEKLRSHYPSFDRMSEVLFNLYYAYLKTGNRTEADKIKQLLMAQYPASRYAGIVRTGEDPQVEKTATQATKAYEDIYNLFIEGRFDEAEAAKKIADSTYQTTRWEPQLLYIEAVYHIRQREDSIAKKSLQTLIAQDPKSAMAEKARTMIDVLNRRSQIEAELAQYQIQRADEEPTKIPSVQKKVVQATPGRPVSRDTAVNRPVVAFKPVQKDTSVNKQMPFPKDTVAEKPVVQAPPKRDTVTSSPVVVNPPVKKDTVTAKPPRTPGEYYFDRNAGHYAMVILDKVDPLFAVEVKNAYTRFNREHYRGQAFDISLTELSADKRLVLIGNFNRLDDAISYMQSARAAAASEVMPWLKADKYSFSVISTDNLPLLLEKKDLSVYQKFLDQNLPQKK